MSIKTWKQAVIERGGDPDGVLLRESGGPLQDWDEIATKAAEDAPERLTQAYVISDSTVDRHGDTVNVDGWNLKNYQDVVLWSHQADIAPIGKALRTYKYGQQLRSVAMFTSDEENAFGAQIARLVKAGFIPSASVGFIGLEGELSDDEDRNKSYWYPIDYKAQELLEWSPVNVGSNRSAVTLGLQLEAQEDKSEIMRLVDWALQQDNTPEELVEWCKGFYDSGVIYSTPATEEKINAPAITVQEIPIEMPQPIELGKLAQEILNG